MASQKQAYSFDVLLSHRHGMHTTAISRLDSFDLASDARNNHSKTFHPPSDTPDLLTDYACQWVYLNPGLTFFQIRSLACWMLRTACRLVEPDDDKLTAPSAPDEIGPVDLQSSPTERFPDCETAWEMLAGLHAHLIQAQKFFHRKAVLKERPAESVKRCFVLPVLEYCLMDWETSRGRKGVLPHRETEAQSTRSLVEDIKRDIRRETVERVRFGPSLQRQRMADGKPSAQHRTDQVPDGTDFWMLPRPQSHLGPIRKPTSPADAADERRRIDIAGPIISAFERAESLVKFQISISPPTPPPSPSRPIIPTSPPPTPSTPPRSPTADATTPARQDSLQSAEERLDRPPDVGDLKTGEVAESMDHLRREASGHEKVTGEEEAACNVQPPRLSSSGYCVCCGIIASSSQD